MRTRISFLLAFGLITVLATSFLSPRSALACGEKCTVDNEGNNQCSFSIINLDCFIDSEGICNLESCSATRRAAAIGPAHSLAFSQCALGSAWRQRGAAAEVSGAAKTTRLKART
jgi:hypothetical protein